jgi:alkyl hydroperoxide reductase subunit AhpC
VSQLRLGYPQFQAHNAEVLVVTATPPERGAKYQELFKFEYPYLCDPNLATAKTYGLPINKKSVLGGAATSGGFLAGLVKTPIELHTYPQPNELKALVTGQVDGFFVIDKEGIVRFVRRGGGMSLLPDNAEIEHVLSGLQEPERSEVS